MKRGILMVVVLLGSSSSTTTHAAVPDNAPTCLGREATIVGTQGSDTMEGTSGDDVIAALGGDDSVRGGGGEDIICGDAGADHIEGRGDLVGGSGDDELKGSIAADRFYPGPGNDFIHGGRTPEGSGYVPDEVRYALAAHGVHVDLHNGVANGEGRDELHGIEDVFGSPHADTLIGTGGGRLVSGGGDDRVIGGSGPYDELDFRASPRGVTVDLAAGRASGWGNLTITGVENINGSYFDDLLIGDGARNEIIGDLGTDVIKGGPGSDRLFEACNCAPFLFQRPESFNTDGSVHGGHGSDWVFGTHGENRLFGGPGRDRLLGRLGDDLLDGGPGSDLADFGGYYDRYYTNEPLIFVSWAFEDSVSVDLTTGEAEGQGYDRLTRIENVRGSDRDDTLLGDVAPNRLFGMGGNDTLSGGLGQDLLNGGPFVDRCDGPADRRVDCEI